jgi:hypothetical protein
LHTPTQKKVSIPIVVKIAKKIQNGLFASTIAIKDNKNCSGHHRYLVNLLANKLPEIVPGELRYGHSSYEWSLVTYSSEDFDSAEEREYYTL